MALLKPILTVTLNPAIDKMLDFASFCAGFENNARNVFVSAGGKGINVSRALKCLGVKSIACGFAAGALGQNLLRDLLLEGIEHNFVFIQGETRVNLTILDKKTGKVTRILEPGPVIDQKDLASFRSKFSRMAQTSDWIVLSGRRINGTPVGFYRQLTEIGCKANAKVIVDANGEDLRFALEGKPFLVKPNLAEAKAFLKQELQTQKQLKDALKKFLCLGARNVIISLGPKGAVATDGKVYCLASGPKINAVNTLGCGDALTAGFICALARNGNFYDALSFGTAAGAANALSILPGHFSRAQMGGILQNVVVKDI